MPEFDPPTDVQLEELFRLVDALEATGQLIIPLADIPAQVAETALSLQPDIDNLSVVFDRWIANSQAEASEDLEGFAGRRMPSDNRWDDPTAEELQVTEQALRTRVVPETPVQEVQQAVEGIPDDYEKARLAFRLIDAMKDAWGVSPTPWAVFVLVFWLAMKMNPDEVGALALAYAVMCNVKLDD